MPRVKVSDLIDVEKRAVPLLVQAVGSDTMHITSQFGYIPDADLSSSNRFGFRIITDCNLAIAHAHTCVHAPDSRQTKLCSRCGDQERFDEVWHGYLEYNEKCQREREERVEREMQEYEAEMEQMSDRLTQLRAFLLYRLHSHKLPFVPDDEIAFHQLNVNGDGYVRAVRFEYNGQVYEVQEIEKE